MLVYTAMDRTSACLPATLLPLKRYLLQPLPQYTTTALSPFTLGPAIFPRMGPFLPPRVLPKTYRPKPRCPQQWLVCNCYAHLSKHRRWRGFAGPCRYGLYQGKPPCRPASSEALPSPTTPTYYHTTAITPLYS